MALSFLTEFDPISTQYGQSRAEMPPHAATSTLRSRGGEHYDPDTFRRSRSGL